MIATLPAPPAVTHTSIALSINSESCPLLPLLPIALRCPPDYGYEMESQARVSMVERERDGTGRVAAGKASTAAGTQQQQQQRRRLRYHSSISHNPTSQPAALHTAQHLAALISFLSNLNLTPLRTTDGRLLTKLWLFAATSASAVQYGLRCDNQIFCGKHSGAAGRDRPPTLRSH